MPSLYANIVSANATIPANNNTSLYNPIGGNAIPISGNVNANNVNVSNNVTVGGEISANGNITTNGFFIGNGSQLTGIVSSYGNANVAVFLPTYTGNLAGDNLALQGEAAVTGNIVTSGFYIGDGSLLSGITADYSNANVANYLPIFSGNISAGNIAVVNAITGATLNISSTISAVGDISTQGNLRTLGAQGNIAGADYIAGNFFVGDGSLLTNVTSTGNYSNSNVVTLMAAFGSNTVSTTGNITSGYLFGNGSQLTGLPATYGNANVADFLPVYNGNVNAPTVFGQGMQVQGYDYVQMQYSNATALPVTPYDIGTGSWFYLDAGGGVFQSNTTGTLKTITLGNDATINAGGNVTAPYYFGNGSQLTGLPEGYGNANVVTFLANFGSNVISTTGSITGGNITATGNLSVLGNLFSDDITSTNVIVYGDQVITGNLTVQGNTTTINSNVITTNDKTITVANNQSTGANVDGAGIEAGNPAIATWLYNDQTVSWQSNIGITPTANATQNLGGTQHQWNNIYAVTGEFAGNINTAGNISGGNVLLGYLLGASDVTATGNVTGAQIIGNGSQLSSITGSNVSGQVANALIAGTVYTAAQPNITTVGTLTSLTSSGNISTTGNVTGSYILGNGSQLTGIVSSYGNSNVADYLPTYTGNLAGLTGNIGTDTSNSNITLGGSGTGANVTFPGNINLTGSSPRIYVGNNSAQYSILNGVSAGLNIGNSAGFINIGGNMTPSSGNISIGNVPGTPNGANTVFGGNVFILNGNLRTTAGSTGNVFNTANSISIGTTSAVGINIGANSATLTTINGNASVTGNITASYFLGNGSQLTGITATYNDSNVATFLAAFGSNTISSTGNITTTANISGGNLLGIGSAITGINAFGNVAVAGQTTVSADNATDTLTLVAGTNITITTDAPNNKVTITSTASGGETLSPFLLMGG